MDEINASKILAKLTIIVNILGVIGNGIMLTVLNRWSMGGKLPTILFLAQAVLDLIVCLQSAVVMIQPRLWLTNNVIIDQVLCRLWHSQLLYWFMVQMSIGNLVLIGFERFCALVYPLRYQKWHSTKVACLMFSGNLIYNIIFSTPNVFEARLLINETNNGSHICVTNKDAYINQILKRLMLVYAFLWFIFIYFIGLILLIFFYVRIIMALRHSAKLVIRRSALDLERISMVSSMNINRNSCVRQSNLNIPGTKSRGSNTSTNAPNQFTRIAIIITIFYVLCITYDAIAYILGKNEIIVYGYGSIEHTFGMFTVSLNSFANPVIYFCFVVRESCFRRISKSQRNFCSIYSCCKNHKLVVSSSSLNEKTDYFKTKSGRMPRTRRTQSRMGTTTEEFMFPRADSSSLNENQTLCEDNLTVNNLRMSLYLYSKSKLPISDV